MKSVRPIRIEGEVAYITLTKGSTAIIDAAAYAKASTEMHGEFGRAA